MATAAKKILEEALALNEADRTSLAALILESLEPSDPDAEATWQKEIERRLSELDSGLVEPIPWESGQARLSGKLDAVDSG